MSSKFITGIIYRKGRAHENADGLSRRHCEASNCNYCTRVELREVTGQERSVGRLILEGGDLEEWSREQREDSDLAVIFQGKVAGVRPS